MTMPSDIENQQLLHDRMQQLFKTSFSAMDIAEPLLLFDADTQASEVRGLLEIKSIEISGILDCGQVTGYVIREELQDGCCLDHHHSFEREAIIPQFAPYQEVIEALDKAGHCFVTFLGKVAAVIRKTDIAKPSVRMWLFGLITIAEMNMSNLVEQRFPNSTWQEQLSEERLGKAKALLGERQRHGQKLRLADCLYFSDKASILAKDASIRADLGFASRKEAKSAVSKLESLRNSLAHAHDIVTYDWDAIVQMSRRLDRMLGRLGNEVPEVH
jgi:hypothetical protein